jgi:hypothetical protein
VLAERFVELADFIERSLITRNIGLVGNDDESKAGGP